MIRPDHELVRQICTRIRDGSPFKAACLEEGITASKIGSWRRYDPSIHAMLTEALADRDDRLGPRPGRPGYDSEARSEARRLQALLQEPKPAGQTHHFVLTPTGRRCAHCRCSALAPREGRCEPVSGVFYAGTDKAPPWDVRGELLPRRRGAK